MSTAVNTLYTMAEDRFGSLKPAEISLLDHLNDEMVLDFGGDDEKKWNPEYASDWSKNHNIRSEVLRWICLTPPIVSRINVRGIHMRSASLEGDLDLTSTSISFAIVLENCKVNGVVTLTDAQTSTLSFTGSIVNGLVAERIEIRGNLFLDNGFQSQGEVILTDARTSTVELTGSNVNGLVADRIEIRGSIFLNNGFQSEGEVRMLGARISGDLACGGGKFLNAKQDALDFSGARIEGNVFLDNKFHANGATKLIGTQVDGELRCTGGFFRNPQDLCMNAYRAQIGGGAVFGHENPSDNHPGLIAEGELRLQDANIGGNLVFRNTSLENEEKVSIDASKSAIGGDLYLNGRFVATGKVILNSAKIGRSLRCHRGHFLGKGNASPCLQANGTQVAEDVFLDDEFVAGSMVELIRMSIGQSLSCKNAKFLEPKEAVVGDGIHIEGDANFCEGFYSRGIVRLAGARIGGSFDFTGARFEGSDMTGLIAQEAHVQHRFRWVNVSMSERSILNLELAKVDLVVDDPNSWPSKDRLFLNQFIYNGFYNHKTISLSQRLEWLARQPSQPYRSQPFEHLVSVMRRNGYEAAVPRIGYRKEETRRKYGGYSIGGRLWKQVLRFTIGHGYFPQIALLWAACVVLIGWVVFDFAYDAKFLTQLNDKPLAFSPLSYSLDTFLPIISTGETAAWGQSAKATGIFRFYLWLHIAFGWMLTTLGVLGFTGLVRRRD